MDDNSLQLMWPLFGSKDEILIWLEDTRIVGLHFRLALKNREARLKKELIVRTTIEPAEEFYLGNSQPHCLMQDSPSHPSQTQRSPPHPTSIGQSPHQPSHTTQPHSQPTHSEHQNKTMSSILVVGMKKGFRPAKSTSKKHGTFVPKKKARRKGPSRQIKIVQPDIEPEDSDGDDGPPGSDDSDDSNFDANSYGSESDDVLENYVEEEFEQEENEDVVVEKDFEDYLDGSSVMDNLYKNGKVVGHMDFGSIKLESWMIFSTKDHFLGVFRDFCIQEGFAVRVDKGDSLRYTASCIVEACDWRIHASKLVDGISWAIKTMCGEHKLCRRLEENPMVTCDWLCRHLLGDITANPNIPVESLQKLCMERYRINVKKRLFYKVKSMTKEHIHGGFAKSYSLLPAYAEVIKKTNPGSYALVTWTRGSVAATPQFKACFFSFAAQVRGFLKGCRPIIGIDGAHLSGYYKGCLLTAVSIDGNNEIFVIAYSIVDTESGETWGYFFQNLRLLFSKEGITRDDWTFISDRMKGVETSLYNVFPKATRRVCAQHLYSNCKNGGWSGTAFHKLFWIAADAYNDYVYEKALKKITELDPAATEYLQQVDEGQWSRHVFDPKVCCDHNTTNFVESFNACTKPYRDLPVLTLLEAIRSWCMKRIGVRFDKAMDLDPSHITEYAKKIIKERGDESRFCYLTRAGGGEFEVRDGHVLFPIKLENGTCGCGVWQGTGIPCKHVLRVIFDQRREPNDFVSPYFKGTSYKLTYAEHIHPMPDSTQWPSFQLPQIEPPPFKRGAGRPPKQRKRGRFDPKKGKRNSTVKCGKCKEVGHNILTCKWGAMTKKKKSDAASASTSAPPKVKKKIKEPTPPSTSK
ncbi:uncharacterized protein LOC125496971 [Beta vulgaris subsp. vulgaris]|uniref:uncharacterized protein LOC125496971 n=1 Tax=Beta vulgaris subsp. vulgaris TaxID=3555 RepID=UPI00254890C0|nr:uncharacterized protein LOC125496971 [Beta vulgaris subsp. vulgaris]